MRAVTGNELGAPPARRDDLPARTRGAGEVVVPGHAPSVNPIDDGIAAGMAKDMVPHEFPVTLADREDVVNVPSRVEESQIAQEQAALRRVATLVARGVSQDEVFAAVNEEVGWLVGADPTSLLRFEADDTVTLVAAWSSEDAGFPIRSRPDTCVQTRSRLARSAKTARARLSNRSWRGATRDPRGSRTPT